MRARDAGFLIRGAELRADLDRVVADLRARTRDRHVTRADVAKRFLREGIARYEARHRPASR